MTHTCQSCGGKAHFECGNLCGTSYCGVECRDSDWEQHASICASISLQDFQQLLDQFTRALGTYLQKWRPAAPPALITSINQLWAVATQPAERNERWMQNIVYRLEQMMDVADAEVTKLSNFEQECRLFNLRNPQNKPGVPEQPTYTELTTGKRDPRRDVCDLQNIQNAKQMLKDLIQMQDDLLQCTQLGSSMVLRLLNDLGLRADASRLWNRCIALRKRKLILT